MKEEGEFGMKMKKREGVVYVLVVVIFLFVCMFSALMISVLNQTVFQTHMYGMNMKCYYMNNQAAEAVIAALMDRDNDLLKNGSYPMSDTMVHYDDEDEIVGESKITLQKENHNYYGEDEDWIAAYITTTIPDERMSHQGEDYSYESVTMILVVNPNIRLYNINPALM